MDYLHKIIGDFEIHSVEGIIECFENGIDPNQIHNDKPLVYEMINMYLRSPKFKDCIKAFVDYGLKFEDKVLLSVLLDDARTLDRLLTNDKTLLYKKYSLNCTFTPLYQVSLLHICAEYNHLSCAKILVNHGIDINNKAGVDNFGFGGQSPIFHTVNQHANACLDVLEYLVSQSADLSLTVQGLIWGKGYEWETFIPSVNPISYAMMGLLRQFQRTEQQIYKVVSLLLKAAYSIDYFPTNVPNKYLNN
ncbi:MULTISPECIES: ankyrin repeat domain-containing protein [unclassified Arcicella]|uniref:ankyrin repeat domain-containing protein n=1 Tax=unclassified Arcicella TaxID=2644986 RepID=UPI002854923C|nr:MULTISPECIES: ankyrin repeat domain-containing protein [unclassified Arcicella]MDR6563041.1 ankyrin repeat protein [Arcicella sp. BE51]MDR6813125.1 ankyrin repeat protein [Arcicella sp. BE140]MDR6824439.1 ankyrin repeat protein [Arcicella sp. BE139]